MECFGEKNILARDLVLLDFWDVTLEEEIAKAGVGLGVLRCLAMGGG